MAGAAPSITSVKAAEIEKKEKEKNAKNRLGLS
jgi:hypothetical protein